MSGSLLVNFVFCPPVGHAIEALHAAHGYHRADPELRIGLALHADTPVELARLCPFITDVYPVRVDVFDGDADFADQLSAIPPVWDWVRDSWHQQERAAFPGLDRYFRQAERYFEDSGSRGIAGGEPPGYRAGEEFRLQIPVEAALRAERRFAVHRPRIAVLPAGSAGSWRYPTVGSWRLILDALLARWPLAQFCFVGKHRADGRTSTGFGAAMFAALERAVPRAVNVVDIPLVDQLAAVAACDLLISPHTGFGMAALATGTPWLSIAGNAWPEYYFNGTPFYSVLPDLDRYPCYTLHGPEPEPVADEGRRSPSMCRERIAGDLDEIVAGAERLVDGAWDFDTAMRDHVRRMLALRGGDRGQLWSIDGVHLRYLPRPSA